MYPIILYNLPIYDKCQTELAKGLAPQSERANQDNFTKPNNPHVNLKSGSSHSEKNKTLKLQAHFDEWDFWHYHRLASFAENIHVW